MLKLIHWRVGILDTAMSGNEAVHCYNKGCSKTFKISENHSGACTFHPGEPYFHDAYKEWTCCKKKSVDFTEFLNYKGCKTSFHNSAKPAEKEKPKFIEVPEEASPPVPRPREPMPRPNREESMTQLEVEVTTSLKNALAEQLSKMKVCPDGDNKEKVLYEIGLKFKKQLIPYDDKVVCPTMFDTVCTEFVWHKHIAVHHEWRQLQHSNYQKF